MMRYPNRNYTVCIWLYTQKFHVTDYWIPLGECLPLHLVNFQNLLHTTKLGLQKMTISQNVQIHSQIAGTNCCFKNKQQILHTWLLNFQFSWYFLYSRLIEVCWQ
jgi:hypothetical protein